MRRAQGASRAPPGTGKTGPKPKPRSPHDPNVNTRPQPLAPTAPRTRYPPPASSPADGCWVRVHHQPARYLTLPTEGRSARLPQLGGCSTATRDQETLHRWTPSNPLRSIVSPTMRCLAAVQASGDVLQTGTRPAPHAQVAASRMHLSALGLGFRAGSGLCQPPAIRLPLSRQPFAHELLSPPPLLFACSCPGCRETALDGFSLPSVDVVVTLLYSLLEHCCRCASEDRSCSRSRSTHSSLCVIVCSARPRWTTCRDAPHTTSCLR